MSRPKTPVEGTLYVDTFAPGSNDSDFGILGTIVNIEHEGLGELLDNGLNKAFKYDGGKARMDLIDPDFQLDLAKVLTIGSDKYDETKRVCDNNWRQGGMRWGQVYASLQRHLTAFWQGEETDEESCLSHLAHAAANIMFLHYYARHARHLDDRDHKWRRPRKVFLDIDGVLANWNEGMYHRVSLTDDFIEWPDEGGPPHWQWVTPGVKFPGDHLQMLLDLEPYENGHNLPFEPAGYVTHRPKEFEGATRSWLNGSGFPITQLVMVENREDKVEVLKGLGCDLFVEDNFNTFVELNNAGILCLLMDRPYNRKFDVGQYRITSLQEVTQWA